MPVHRYPVRRSKLDGGLHALNAVRALSPFEQSVRGQF
jgi:hypothetical protein